MKFVYRRSGRHDIIIIISTTTIEIYSVDEDEVEYPEMTQESYSVLWNSLKSNITGMYTGKQRRYSSEECFIGIYGLETYQIGYRDSYYNNMSKDKELFEVPKSVIREVNEIFKP